MRSMFPNLKTIKIILSVDKTDKTDLYVEVLRSVNGLRELEENGIMKVIAEIWRGGVLIAHRYDHFFRKSSIHFQYELRHIRRPVVQGREIIFFTHILSSIYITGFPCTNIVWTLDFHLTV
ncbi:hypothetical protein AX14_005188 [Amanita brunnescens Koide BX004]|nr:hypothetical protein AX14_005188 [Amanita brunnescens Koide BX004]